VRFRHRDFGHTSESSSQSRNDYSLDSKFGRTIYLPPAKGGKISTRTGAVSGLSRSAE
jgi:hypothetical protein